jgi:hypothetical protein
MECVDPVEPEGGLPRHTLPRQCHASSDLIARQRPHQIIEQTDNRVTSYRSAFLLGFAFQPSVRPYRDCRYTLTVGKQTIEMPVFA